MPGYESEPDHTWDEYDWERFLQQQDHKTEKYMELLEKYLDDPQRDQIIAREMGWTQSLSQNEWSDEVDALLAEESEGEQSDARSGASIESGIEGFEDHGLYRAAFALTVWIDQLFDDDSSLQNQPAAVKLATHSALASAKLAAALSDEDVDEIGMTIAYLKRALKAITTSMEAAAQLLSDKLISVLAVCRAAATALPGARRHHLPDGRVSRRMAAALRQPLGEPLNEIAASPSKLMETEATPAEADVSELDLVKRCQSGETDAFDQLVTRYRTRVFGMIYNMVHNEQDAWDLAQDSFVKAWKSITRFRGQSSFYTWIYRIVTNVTIDWLRKKQVKGTGAEFDDSIELKSIEPASRTVPKADALPFQRMEQNEIRERIDEAIKQLSPEHRAVILMKETEGMQYHEIAEALECSIGTVMSRLFYARKKLQNLLRDVYENV